MIGSCLVNSTNNGYYMSVCQVRHGYYRDELFHLVHTNQSNQKMYQPVATLVEIYTDPNEVQKNIPTSVILERLTFIFAWVSREITTMITSNISQNWTSIYSRVRIIFPPLKIIPSFKIRKAADPKPLYPLEVRQQWIISNTVINRSLHDVLVQNLFLVVLIST